MNTWRIKLLDKSKIKTVFLICTSRKELEDLIVNLDQKYILESIDRIEDTVPLKEVLAKTPGLELGNK